MTDGLLFGQFCSSKSTATSRFGELVLVLLGALFSSTAFAQDPNDFNYLPAIPTEMAHEGLLLDVVRVGTRIVAVGERGYIVYSDDEGKTWAQSTVPVSQTLTAVTFGSDTTGWAVGHEGIILRTDDGGENWALQLTGYDASRQELVLGNRRLERARAAVEEGVVVGGGVVPVDQRQVVVIGPEREPVGHRLQSVHFFFSEVFYLIESTDILQRASTVGRCCAGSREFDSL